MAALVIIGILIAAVVGWSMRSGRSGHRPAMSARPPTPRVEATAHTEAGSDGVRRPRNPDSIADLERWVAAGLLSGEQAEAIEAFEAGRRMVAPRRISLVTEALGYAGAALGFGGAVAGLGPAWDDMGVGVHLGVAVLVLVLLLTGGWLLRNQDEAAFRRLAAVLWLMAVGATAWAAAVLAIEVLAIEVEGSDPWVPLAVSGTTAAMALVLWRTMQRGLQQAALFVATVAVGVTALVALPGEVGPWAFGVIVWAWSLVWLVLGWRVVLRPSIVAVVLGTATALAAPLLFGGGEGWLLALGLATSAAAVAASISLHSTALLGAGTVAMFGYVTALIVKYFGGAFGMPIALGAAGALIVALAVAAGRLGRQAPPSNLSDGVS